ncbi:G-type lectin S-receptor-like serine/threonine-protein kinase SRK [Salvia miltiorrhiza]|uniref:G-type lectin S-receptor-like serine/threonine-protein kinase SRK n=1 Tax=Salvia miltiorrhiza TaxID=226208 RepID=UPI0025AC247F|nr:G-type lectin S-receptor-like serine/threonine-protein kinase SRK [Salvia miltiorrhiza]
MIFTIVLGQMRHAACLLFLLSSIWLCNAEDTMRPNTVLRENDTLVSAAGVFELGFFRDAVSGHVFVGIWFKNLAKKKPVWVANRDNPLEHLYAAFMIRDDGNLIATDRRQAPMLVNYGKLATTSNTTATLLDSGNLVLRQENGGGGGEIIWQSFDFPTDTLLPGMRLGWFRLQTPQPRRQILLSWLGPQNPSRGDFTVGTAYEDASRVAVWNRDVSHVDFGWIGSDGLFKFVFKNSFSSFNLSYASTPDDKYVAFDAAAGYDMSWLVIASAGQLDEYALREGRLSLVRHDLCEASASVCLVATEAAAQRCGVYGDAFAAVNGSVPPSSASDLNVPIIDDFDDCELTCRTNCSCVAFAFGDSGCRLYYGSWSDLRGRGGDGNGVFYVRRVAARRKHGEKMRKLAIIILISSITPVILAAVVFWCFKRRHKRIFAANQLRDAKSATTIDIWKTNDVEFIGEEHKLTWFGIGTIENATDGFNAENKLGEGGFGPVYKGKLPGGQEIAVKRLSKRSVQGAKEFRNEAAVISMLQHRNLVKLLGCCIQGEEEYILVYEYLINRSLDSFIFDDSKQALLDWKTRVGIIEGIAQGILYLHKYSRLRIIHRDLKASNILLDGDMRPKISDFGMARIYGENEARARTTKIAGTYGYMSPEYAMEGNFSEKSDVFSFGIIVLEIISGKRNVSFFEADLSLNLLGYAWKLWKEGRSIEFLDATLQAGSCEAAKYVRLGLLCVQERAADRPAMPDFVAMASNDVAALPLPKQPAFLS